MSPRHPHRWHFFEIFLACPARFERATYALEEFVAAGISMYFNGLQRKYGTM